MCDTFIATSSFSGTSIPLFGKNSDREPNEAQQVAFCPKTNPTETEVRCTYISIPQVRETHSVVLSKPFQMWGAEMGLNEYGLSIGNEAVFTKIPIKKDNSGLTGMDLVRLALERCKSAEEAIDQITRHIETYGQNACGGYYNRKFYYHNSFILADPRASWVLETAGEHWAAKEIKKGYYAISNGLTLENELDKYSNHAESFARKKRWIKNSETFNFRKAYSDRLYTHLSKGKLRREQSLTIAHDHRNFDLRYGIELLSHHSHADPTKSDASSLCMHGNSFLNPSQTCGSMMAELSEGLPVAWLTGTSNPCMSVFFPAVPGNLDHQHVALLSPTEKVDDSLWWKSELLHRMILSDYASLKPIIDQDRRRLQNEIIRDFLQLRSKQRSDVAFSEFTSNSIQKIYDHVLSWIDQVAHNKQETKSGWNYRRFMKSYNRKSGITA